MTFLGLGSSEWLAILTAALVGVTGFYAYLTWKLSSHAEASANAARRVLQLSAMPILHGRSARGHPPARIHVQVTQLGRSSAFRLQAVVRQGQKEWPSGLFNTFQVPEGQERQLGINVDSFPDFNQPYDVELTYSDATGTYYRSTRTGYINSADFKLEELNADGDWEQLV